MPQASESWGVLTKALQLYEDCELCLRPDIPAGDADFGVTSILGAG